MFKSSAVCVLITLAIVLTSFVERGTACLSVKSVPKLDTDRLIKKNWYVIYKTPTTGGSKCGVNQFTKVEGDILNYEHYYTKDGDKAFQSIPGKVLLSADAVVDAAEKWKSYILATDYINYLVLYACSEAKTTDSTKTSEIITIMSNGKTLNLDVLLKAKKAIEDYGLTLIEYKIMSQDGCPEK